MAITYDLRDKTGNSSQFYRKLYGFSKTVADKINETAGSILHGYSSFITEKLNEKYRSREEYAIACALNIIVGGYEMRALNIPSQCVMLDYCGCRKHWHDTGIATDFNVERLLKVVSEGTL
jgi:hypothetical protein